MTTAVKPLPPHGSYARANGSPRYRKPCKCETCSETRNRRKKQYRVNSERGHSARVDATPAREALNQMRQTMTWAQIAATTGAGISNIQDIAAGRRATTTRDTIAKILAIQPQPTTDPNKFVDATGTARRIQAMRAIGHSLSVLEPLTGSDRCHLSLICLGRRPTVRYRVARSVADVYKTLAAQPAPEGWTADVTRAYAASQCWAPPAAWDDIDDPAAVADWTGHCGTDRGWWIHTLNNIPTCARCETAHQQWKTERAHLTNTERWSEIGKARAAASNRGVNLAEDARELLGFGVDIDQAAARLGVTRNHLQQELLRHPAIDEKTAKAGLERAA